MERDECIKLLKELATAVIAQGKSEDGCNIPDDCEGCDDYDRCNYTLAYRIMERINAIPELEAEPEYPQYWFWGGTIYCYDAPIGMGRMQPYDVIETTFPARESKQAIRITAANAREMIERGEV